MRKGGWEDLLRLITALGTEGALISSTLSYLWIGGLQAERLQKCHKHVTSGTRARHIVFIGGDHNDDSQFICLLYYKRLSLDVVSISPD